jgi:hypothetical protein
MHETDDALAFTHEITGEAFPAKKSIFLVAVLGIGRCDHA